jgi:predicted ATPase
MALQSRGYDVVKVAATAVMAAEQALGNDEPRALHSFIDKIVSLQRQRQTQSVRPSSDAVQFEHIHVRTYLTLGYDLVDIPKAEVADRADMVEAYLASWK